MSIESQLEDLQTNLTNAKSAVETKGGTVGDTGLAGLASEIAGIPSGGQETQVAITKKGTANIGSSFSLDTAGGEFFKGGMVYSGMPSTALVGVKASDLLDANGRLHWTFMLNSDEVIYDTAFFYQYALSDYYNFLTGTVPYNDGDKVGGYIPLRLSTNASDWESLGSRSTTGTATLSGTIYQQKFFEAYDSRYQMDKVTSTNTQNYNRSFNVSNLPIGFCVGYGGWASDADSMNGNVGTFINNGAISDITGNPYISRMKGEGSSLGNWDTPTSGAAKMSISIVDSLKNGSPGGELSIVLWVADGITLESALNDLDTANTNLWWIVNSTTPGDFSVTPSAEQIQSWNVAMSHLGTTNTITLKDSPAGSSSLAIYALNYEYGKLEPLSNFPNWGTIRIGSDPSSWEEVGEPFLCFGRANQTIPTRKLYPR